MSSYTMSPRPGWAVGDEIAVYALDITNRAIEPPVFTTQVGEDRTATFQGLPEQGRYVATNGKTSVRFSMLPDTPAT